MVTQVTLGNFFTTSSGQQVLGGAGGSGLDTQTIIKDLVTAESQPATNDQNQITANGKVTSALTQLQQLLSTFQSSVDALRDPPGVGNAANNVFQFTTGSVTASDGSNASNYLTVTTTPGATIQSYTINSIKQLATAASQSSPPLPVATADTPVVGSGGEINLAKTLTVSSFETGAAGSGNVTASVNSVANLSIGQQVTIGGATGTLDGIDDTQINGVQTITSIDTVNHTITFSTAGTATTGGVSDPEGGAATATTMPPLIEIDAGDSLNQFAAKFNAVSAQTGVSAAVIQLQPGSYVLTFTATTTGTAGDFDLNSPTTDPDGVFGGGMNLAVGGQDSLFYMNGIATPIDSQTNNVSNVINGLTFNLVGTYNVPDANGSSLTVNIQPDATTVQNSINAFVSAYNAIQTFAAQQTQLNSDGTYASTAILANNQTFRQTMSDLNQEIISQVTGLPGSLNSLASLGITLTTQPAGTDSSGNAIPQVNNILTVNDGQLTSALSTNYSGVSQLFGLTVTTSNAALAVVSATNSLGASQFTITNSGGTFTANISGGGTVNLTATPLLSGEGYTLTGPAGSALAGLTMIYASNADATINVVATNGIASQLYNTSNAATTANTGTLAVAQAAIQTQNTSLNNDITRVNTLVNQYQTSLLQQFAALEQAVSEVNSLLTSLNANDVAKQEAANIG